MNSIIPDPAAATNQLQKGLEGVISGDGVNAKDLMSGTVTQLARTVSKSMDGLSPSIIEVIVALVMKDQDQISQALKQLGHELKFDGELLDALVSVVLCDFNPSNTQKQAAFG